MKNLKSVLCPAVTFLLITLLLNYALNARYFEDGYWMGVVPWEKWLVINIVPCLVLQVPAFFTCWFFILRKSAIPKFIWLNYIIWIVLWNFQRIIDIVNRIVS